MQTISPFRNAAQKQEERLAKRNAVLRAAVEMFNQRGFHATSLDDVAASLGISKRTIYHYLENKDQVLLECLTVGLSQLLEAVDKARAGSGDGRDRLVHFLHGYAEVIMGPFGRCVVLTGENALSAESRPLFRKLRRKFDTAMRDIIAEAVTDGSIPDIDVRMTAFTLAGALSWTAHWHRPDGDLSPTQIANEMVGILMAGVDGSGR